MILHACQVVVNCEMIEFYDWIPEAVDNGNLGNLTGKRFDLVFVWAHGVDFGHFSYQQGTGIIHCSIFPSDYRQFLSSSYF